MIGLDYSGRLVKSNQILDICLRKADGSVDGFCVDGYRKQILKQILWDLLNSQ